MKMNRTAICVALLFAAIFATTITSTARADSKHITITSAVTIGGSTVLPAGTYNVVWSGSGPDVQVSFMKGNKTMATASAKLVLEKSQYHRAVETTTMPDNSNVLTRIQLGKRSLVFDQAS